MPNRPRDLTKSREPSPARQSIPPQPTAVTYQERTEVHIGPLPLPEQLAKYDVIVPGGAERIFRIFEMQAEHRMHLERVVVEGNHRRANWGLLAGVIVSLAGMVLSGILGVAGQQWASGAVALADLATLAGVFVYGSTVQQREREAKAQRQATEVRNQRRR